MSIILEDVHKSFGDKHILRGFTLEVEEGETVALIGASGSGKSVTLKHIVGLMSPDRGRVEVDGTSVLGLPREELYELRRRVGYVFQFAALFDSMTIGENVGMGLRRLPEITEEEIRERVAASLAVVDLAGFEDRYPSEISGGQRKRVGLARGIATRPRYVLYDEPTTGLDPVTTTVIDRLILRTRDELEVTSIMVTHDMKSAYRVADRIGLLYEGQVRFIGTPDEIRATDDPIVKGFVEGLPELLESGT